MQDFIPKGNGNSRSLKSSIPDGTTWEQALEMLRNGTFPIDIGAANEDGVLQKGNPLNKSTLLKDETAALFNGLPENPVPDEVFQILSKAALAEDGGGLSKIDGTKIELVKFSVVSYTGTGRFGESSPCSITFPFRPDVVLPLFERQTQSNSAITMLGGVVWEGLSGWPIISGYKESYTLYRGFKKGNVVTDVFGKISSDGRTLTWYITKGNPGCQFNESYHEYFFMGFKFG